MYRRRRPARAEIAFGFDCFLDVVANVIGIIVRLILVAWVGARSYSTAMQWTDQEPALVQSLSVPKAEDDPLSTELQKVQRSIEDARTRLLARLAELELSEQKVARIQEQAVQLASRRKKLAAEVDAIDPGKFVGSLHQTNLSLSELKERGAKVRAEIKALETQELGKQVLKYHAPVSKTVHADEVFFECRQGRVTFIDLPAFLQDVRSGMADKGTDLKTQWQVMHTTGPVGAFRLRYTIEREKSPLESLGTSGPAGSGFRFGLSEWVLEPVAPERGETLEAALAEGSEFRRHVDHLDGRITVATFWFYPDSFELFRRLRDHLYDRDVEVAGRPLTDDAPIAASRQGTASRAQ